MNSSISASQIGPHDRRFQRASALDLNAADTRLRCSRCFLPSIAKMEGPHEQPDRVS